jgi:SAM-dependent methyltransferase
MKQELRRSLLRAMSILNFFWRLIPFPLRKSFFLFSFVVESRGDSKNALKNLFVIEDELQRVINERALAFGKGEHPKHRLISYHEFFIQNLFDCDSVVDIGCGYGAVARSVAQSSSNLKVLGIDNHVGRLSQAKNANNPPNLEFRLCEIQDFEPHAPLDAVILSNVLEHLTDRVSALRYIVEKTNAKKILIRVPLFERHWTIPLRKELGVNFFQDDDHKIEHTVLQFQVELHSAGLQIQELRTIWGEIWCVATR